MEERKDNSNEIGFYNRPVSPTGRLFLQPELELSIDCFLKFENPVDIFAVKLAIFSLAKTCPLLRSVVTNKKGRPAWRELPEIDIDKLVTIVTEEDVLQGKLQSDDSHTHINHYLGRLPQMSGLTRNSLLWEVHVFPSLRRYLVLRFHHALGDCVSLLALALSSCDSQVEEIAVSHNRPNRQGTSCVGPLVKSARSVRRAWKRMWYTLPYAIQLSNEALFGGSSSRLVVKQGMEVTPRKLASLVLSMDDLKTVKNELNATVNDVLVGVVSYGILKYLRSKQSNEVSEDGEITGLVAVNLRGEVSKDILRSIQEGKGVDWGNRLGYFTLPIPLKHRSNTLDYVRKAKRSLDKKKLSFEAQFVYRINTLITKIFGIKAAAALDYKFRQNTSIFFSNIVGPSSPVRLAKNRVTDIGVTLSSLSAAIDVHLLSYDGKAFIQFLVAEEIIPEPEILCNHVREALKEMITEAWNKKGSAV